MNNRLYKFDNLKFFLILLVVIGHLVEMYCNKLIIMRKIFIFIYTFHMPLFIFITGLFTKRIYSYKNIPVKKIIFYVYIIIFMKIMFFVIGHHFNIYNSFELFSGSEDFWYLGAVIAYLLLVPIINKINFKFLFLSSVVLGLFSGYDSNINDFLYLSRIIVFFPFFILGYYFSDKKEDLINICDNRILKLISFIIIIIFAYICFYKLNYIYKLRMLFTGKNPYSYFKDFNCTYKHRIFTYLITFIVGFSIMCLTPKKKIKVVSAAGSRTITVYVLHRIIAFLGKGLGIFDYLLSLFNNNFIYVYILIGISITLFLSLNIFKKIFDYIEESIFIE